MNSIYEIIKANEDICINESLCAKCKGACCKMTPCAYLPIDLDFTKEGLLKLLKEGKSSIKVKIMGFPDGRKVATVPIPMVGIRGRRKDAIDLLSPAVRCIALGANGCELESKPTGAKILIPGEDGILSGGKNPCYNLLQDHQHLILLEWMKHFEVLLNTIEEFTQESFTDLYVRDLLATTLEVLENDAMSEYNKINLIPILKNMQLFSVMLSGDYSAKKVERPTVNHINYLKPDEFVLKKTKKYIETIK